MILADTSIWIEFLKGNPKYTSDFGELASQRKIAVIECIFGELLQGIKSDREARVIQEYWHNLPQIDLTGIWIAAGYLSYREKLLNKGIGLIDATILVAAKKNKLMIWTIDKKLSKMIPNSHLYQP